MKLTAVKCADASWANAGYSESRSGIVCLADVDVLLNAENANGRGGLQAWGWDELPPGVTSICGVPAFQWTKLGDKSENPNGALSVDHVVLHTNDPDKVKQDFQRLGIELKRERSDIYPGITQLFYRPGNGTVIEVVYNKEFTGTFLWGATVVVSDINKAKAALGENSSQPKKAVQPGRHIMTVRHANLNIGTSMAMMTPHVPKGAKL